jgi:anti-sigma B factor antagonist
MLVVPWSGHLPPTCRVREGRGGAACSNGVRSAALAARMGVAKMRDGRLPYAVVDGVPVVTAPEEIDITNAPDLRSAMLEAASDGRGTLVLDMTHTRFCDSSGIHTLLAVHRRAQADGGELLLVIPDPAALRVFAITGIDRVIRNVASLEEAFARKSASGSDGRPPTDDAAEATL